MSHKHERLLEAIFRDPIHPNIHWREIESLLNHLGAAVENVSGARLRVKLNGYEDTLHRPHHGASTLGRQDVKHLREVLARGRVTPALYAESLKKGKSG
ncbi:MAG: type II toxin-antitoxin system HicA family toxin [Burkholderiales bacterium]